MVSKHPEFGSIREIGNKLYIDCRIYNERVRLASGKKDTPENRHNLVLFLNKIGVALDDQTFRFKEYFPFAKQADIEKFSSIERSLFGLPVIKSSDVTLEEYGRQWFEEEAKTLSTTTKSDYAEMLRSRIYPMIGDLTFGQLTPTLLKVFVRNLKHQGGKNAGKFLSAKRMRNILNLVRRIFTEANADNKWQLSDPFPPAFRRIKKIEAMFDDDGDIRHKPREVWLLSEWQHFIVHVPEHYRPLFEAMRMGMIFSELKGLKKDCIHDAYIDIKRSISRGEEKSKLKTIFRGRKIKLTDRLRVSIMQAVNSSKTEYVFTMDDGATPLNYSTILKKIWGLALKSSGLPHRDMYSLRHTFVGWMVLLGIDSARLKNMAGHSSRSGLTEDTYGEFREGLLEEREAILEHLGRDIMEPEEFKRAFAAIYLQERGVDLTAASGMTPDVIKTLASMLATEIRDDKPQQDQVSQPGCALVALPQSISCGAADGYGAPISDNK